jgi:hypothetical protein
MFFLAIAALALVLTRVWPNAPAPLPDLTGRSIVTVGLKPGGLISTKLPVCVTIVLSSSPQVEPAIPEFPQAWLLAIRPQSDRTWAEVALKVRDAVELAKQLTRYEAQILKPSPPADCSSK